MRQYLVVKADQKTVNAEGSLNAIRARIREILEGILGSDVIDSLGMEMVAAPSLGLRWMIQGEADRNIQSENFTEFVVSLDFPNSDTIKQLRNTHEFFQSLGDFQEAPPQPEDSLGSDEQVLASERILRTIGADPVVHLCDLHPCAPARVFGNRSRVREMMGINALHPLTGDNVNVIIIDQGLNRQDIEAHNPACWGGGLAHSVIDPASGEPTPELIKPGSARSTSHGMMIARNILDIAPKAKLYDVPLIPQRIARGNAFASTAHAVFKAAVEKIGRLRASKNEPNSAWILVNAWAIFDRSDEFPIGDYTLDHRRELTKHANHSFDWAIGHPLNRMIRLAAEAKIDIVFGAGNCGQFTASTRCGKHDRGEGRSIWGANAHPSVLTVGAVSANGQWLGYSSQGPAPWKERDPLEKRQKPDVCTPSHFCEDNDPATVNTGTSASTGLAAGVIAAIREDYGPDKVSPLQLREKINAAARRESGGWNARTGNGLLNAAALLKELGPVPGKEH